MSTTLVTVSNLTSGNLSVPSYPDTGGTTLMAAGTSQLFTLTGGIQSLINTGQLGLISVSNMLTNYTTTGSITAPTSLGAVATILTGGLIQLDVEAAIVGQTLTAFQILGKVNTLGSYQLLYSTSSDYTSPKGLLIGTSGDLTTQAAGTSGFFQMNVRGFYAIQIKVTATTTGGTITILSGGL